MIGRTLSHYRITEKLGEGGMGEVSRRLVRGPIPVAEALSVRLPD